MNGTANTISIGTGVLVFLALNGNVRYWVAYVVALLAAQGARSFVELLGPPLAAAWSRHAVRGLRFGLGDTFAGDALPFCVVAVGAGVVFVYGPWYGLPPDEDELDVSTWDLILALTENAALDLWMVDRIYRPEGYPLPLEYGTLFVELEWGRGGVDFVGEHRAHFTKRIRG